MEIDNTVYSKSIVGLLLIVILLLASILIVGTQIYLTPSLDNGYEEDPPPMREDAYAKSSSTHEKTLGYRRYY